MPPRNTLRKRLISEMLTEHFGGKVAILDELRWLVLKKEAAAKGQELRTVTRSQMVSFARTIRAHLAELKMYKLMRPDRLPAGILYRAALNRIHDSELRNLLMREQQPYVIFNIYGGTHEHATQWIRVRCLIRSSEHVDVREDVRVDDKEARISFPITVPITVVAKSKPARSDLMNLARTTIPLLVRGSRPHLYAPYEKIPISPLHSVRGAEQTIIELSMGSQIS